MGIVLKYGNPAVDIAAGFAVGQNQAQDKRRREVLRIMEQERSMRYDTARRMQENTWAKERQEAAFGQQKALQEASQTFMGEQRKADLTFMREQRKLDLDAHRDINDADNDAAMARLDASNKAKEDQWERERDFALEQREDQQRQIDMAIESQIQSGDLILDDTAQKTMFGFETQRQALLQGTGEFKNYDQKTREALLEKLDERKRVFLRTAPKQKVPSAQEMLDKNMVVHNGQEYFVDPSGTKPPVPIVSPAVAAQQKEAENQATSRDNLRKAAEAELKKESEEDGSEVTPGMVLDRMEAIRQRESAINAEWDAKNGGGTAGGTGSAGKPSDTDYFAKPAAPAGGTAAPATQAPTTAPAGGSPILSTDMPGISRDLSPEELKSIAETTKQRLDGKTDKDIESLSNKLKTAAAPPSQSYGEKPSGQRTVSNADQLKSLPDGSTFVTPGATEINDNTYKIKVGTADDGIVTAFSAEWERNQPVGTVQVRGQADSSGNPVYFRKVGPGRWVQDYEAEIAMDTDAARRGAPRPSHSYTAPKPAGVFNKDVADDVAAKRKAKQEAAEAEERKWRSGQTLGGIRDEGITGTPEPYGDDFSANWGKDRVKHAVAESRKILNERKRKRKT